jgi:predicted kinase
VGTGKSAVSRAIAPWLGAFPGAVIVRSDVERKRLFGVAPEERLPARAYAPEVSDQVYAMSRKRAMMALFGGQAAIVDAVQAKPEEREALAGLAARLGAPFTGLWLEAPAKLMRERVEARRGDASDATPSVIDEQLGYDIGAQGFTVIDASRPLEEVAADCLKRIQTA